MRSPNKIGTPTNMDGTPTNMDYTPAVQRPSHPQPQAQHAEDKKKSVVPASEWIVNVESSSTASDDASGADSDADNDAGNSKKDIPMQNFLSKLNQVLLAPKTPVEQGDTYVGAYDCREFARTIRGNWKIIAPALTAASGVAAVALLTIGARGGVDGTQMSLGARWGTWFAGYAMTQATIIFGTTFIPNVQYR